ncbi:inhibitor of nuclear factor kappa-B kinase-interacting protein [Pelodytes ibericus]
MSSDVKQRKKAYSSKDGKDAQRSAPSSGHQTQDEQKGKAAAPSPVGGTKSSSLEVRTLLCLMCVAICGALSWLAVQQSRSFSVLESKYLSLQTQSGAFGDLEDKIKLIFGKLASTDDIVAEVTSSSSAVSRLQQQLAQLHDDVDNIQSNEHLLSTKMHHINTRFHNITDTWKKSLDDMNLHSNSIKAEAKTFHNQVTEKINAADHTLRLVSERLKELEDSTARNLRTVKSQEDDELHRVEKVLDWDTSALDELEKEQSDLMNVNREVQRDLVEFQPKLEECIQHLPSIEEAIRSVLKVSTEMLNLERKTNELTVQVFNTEDNLLKIISEILEIRHALDAMRLDDSILKMQNDISVLKEKTQRISSEQKSDLLLQDEKKLTNEDQD